MFVDLTIDETNNPLDPAQLTEAFVDALAPLEIDKLHVLTIYRSFNRCVLHRLEEVLDKVCTIFLSNGVLPDLKVEGRSREAHLGKRSAVRPANSPMDRAFPIYGDERDTSELSNSGRLYLTIKHLLHGVSLSDRSFAASSGEYEHRTGKELVVPSAFLTDRIYPGSLTIESGLFPLRIKAKAPLGDRVVVPVAKPQLFDCLDQVQDRMIDDFNKSPDFLFDHGRFTRYLGEALMRSSPDDCIHAIGGDEYDDILIISLLYESFCRDISLVEPIKELILATQVVMTKIALSDKELLSETRHPVRLLMNEVTNVGVGWVDLEGLRADPTFNLLENLLVRLVTEYDGDNALVESLLEELQIHSEQRAESEKPDEDRSSGKGNEYRRRISEINSYVSQKIQERINEPLHPVIDEVVNQHYHKFLLSVVQRDGQGSNSWILVIKILDLLLWTVRSEKKDDDFIRYRRFNHRLLANLKKALLKADLSESHCDELLDAVKKVQEASFKTKPAKRRSAKGPFKEMDPGVMAGMRRSGRDSMSGPRELAEKRDESDVYLQQVDKLPIGAWLRFRMEDRKDMHGTLAARMSDIDKLVFINRRGVKIVEKSRTGLAQELRDGTVKIVSDWPLFERGMESVIATLRARFVQPN